MTVFLCWFCLLTGFCAGLFWAGPKQGDEHDG
jgi:hypothetical protein